MVSGGKTRNEQSIAQKAMTLMSDPMCNIYIAAHRPS